MAADLNRIVLIGRLTRDCEVKPLSNTTVCNFSIAVNRRSHHEGNWTDEAQFFDIELYGAQSDALKGYLKKGKQIAVDGALRQHRWESQEGQKRSRVTITANSVQLLGGNSNTGGAENNRYADQGASYNTGSQSAPVAGNIQDNDSGIDNDFQDDIPF